MIHFRASTVNSMRLIDAYIHTCMHARMYAYIHTSISTYVRTYAHRCMHTYNHAYVHTYIIHTYMHACMHAYIHTYIHTYIQTYIHTNIHTYIHTYIHTCWLIVYWVHGNLIKFYLSNGLWSASQCSADFTINPLNDQWASLPDHTGFLLPRPACNASKPMYISYDQFRMVVFCMHVCVLQWRKVCVVVL